MDTHLAADEPAGTVDQDRYRLAQQAELQIRFWEIEGRPAKNRAELTVWVQRSDTERPVVPRPSLLDTYLD